LKISDEMNIIANRLIDIASNLSHGSLLNADTIEILFESGYVIELIDLIHRSDADLIRNETLRTLSYIGENGTAT
jgi:hypothetical protein